MGEWFQFHFQLSAGTIQNIPAPLWLGILFICCTEGVQTKKNEKDLRKKLACQAEVWHLLIVTARC